MSSSGPEFSGGTRLAADGPAGSAPGSACRRGRSIGRSPRTCGTGTCPRPIILLAEPGPANPVVIEGHKRLTGLLLCPQWLPAELNVLPGLTAAHNK